MDKALPTLITVGLILTAFTALPTSAEDVLLTPGLKSTGPDDGDTDLFGGGLSEATCLAVAGPDQEVLMQSASRLTVKTTVLIEEWSSKEDRWTASIDVEWSSAPSALPNDDDASTTYTDTIGEPDVYHDDLGLEWSSSSFGTDGTYRFNAKIGITHEDRAWGSSESDWKQRCSKGDSANIALHVGESNDDWEIPDEICVKTLCISIDPE